MTDSDDGVYEYRLIWKFPKGGDSPDPDEYLNDFYSFRILGEDDLPAAVGNDDDRYAHLPAKLFPSDRPPWLNIKARKKKIKIKVRSARYDNQISLYSDTRNYQSCETAEFVKILFPLETKEEIKRRDDWIQKIDNTAKIFPPLKKFDQAMDAYLQVMSNAITAAPIKCNFITLEKNRRKTFHDNVDAEYSSFKVFIEDADGQKVRILQDYRFRTFLIESTQKSKIEEYVKLINSSTVVAEAEAHDYITLMDCLKSLEDSI